MMPCISWICITRYGKFFIHYYLWISFLPHFVSIPLLITSIFIVGTFLFFFFAGSVGFPGSSDGKSICLHCGKTRVLSLGREDPLEKEMATHSSILAGKSHGPRILVGYSPWGHKESDMTEQLHFKSLKLSFLFCFVLFCLRRHYCLFTLTRVQFHIS